MSNWIHFRCNQPHVLDTETIFFSKINFSSAHILFSKVKAQCRALLSSITTTGFCNKLYDQLGQRSYTGIVVLVTIVSMLSINPSKAQTGFDFNMTPSCFNYQIGGNTYPFSVNGSVNGKPKYKYTFTYGELSIYWGAFSASQANNVWNFEYYESAVGVFFADTLSTLDTPLPPCSGTFNFSDACPTQTFTYSINQGCTVSIFSVTTAKQDATCSTSNDGWAKATPSGTCGTGYQYLWTPGNFTTDSIGGLSPGMYNVRVVCATDTVNKSVIIGSGMVPSSSRNDTICYGSIKVLKNTVSSSGQVFAEGFDSATSTFSLSSTPYSVGTFTVTSSNSNSSQLQTSTTIKTEGTQSINWITYDFTSSNLNILSSPTINLSGLSGTQQITFDHILYNAGSGKEVIEYSIDNGMTWQAFPVSSYAGSAGPGYTAAGFTQGSYNEWVSAMIVEQTMWKSETFNIPAGALTSGFKMRFRLDSPSFGMQLLVDNFKIVGVASSMTFPSTWSPIAGLYNDAALTVPYIAGTLVDSLWAKPLINTNYIASRQVSPSCFATDTVRLTVLASFTSINDTTFCSSGEPNIYITGTAGNTYGWTATQHGTGVAASGTSNPISFSISTNASNNVKKDTVFVSSMNGTCIGKKDTFIISVLPIPKVDSIANIQTCPDGTVAAINFTSPTSGGTVGYKWINNNINIGLAASGNGNIPSFTASSTAGTATITVRPYMLRTAIDTCFGANRVFMINVGNPPAPTTTSCVIYTGNKTLNQLAISPSSGGILNYYNLPSGGSPLPTTTNVVDDTMYYVSQTVAGCESTRIPIKVNRIAPDTLKACAPATVANLTTTPMAGNPVRWYNTPNGGTPLANTASLTTGIDTLYVEEGVLEPLKTWTSFYSSTNPMISIAYGTNDTIYFSEYKSSTFTINFYKMKADSTGKTLINMRNVASTSNPSNSLLYVDSSGVRYLYVAVENPKAFYKINLATNVVTNLALPSTSNGPSDMEYDPISKSIYWVYGPNIYKYNTSTNTNIIVYTASTTEANSNGGFIISLAYKTSTVPNSNGKIIYGYFWGKAYTLELTPTPTSSLLHNLSGAGMTWTTFDIDYLPNGTSLLSSGNMIFNYNETTRIDTCVVIPSQFGSPGENKAMYLAVKSNSEVFFTRNFPYKLLKLTIVPPNPCNRVPVIVVVNPTPLVAPTNDQVICNNGTVSTINFSTTTTGGTVSYAWINNNPSIGLAASGTGNIASFTGINTGSAPVTAQVIVTPTLTNAGLTCMGKKDTFLIVVNPVIKVDSIADKIICPGSNSTAINFTTPITGSTVGYKWTNDNPSFGLSASGFGNIPPFTASNTAGTATITVTPFIIKTVGDTCFGISRRFTLIGNPAGNYLDFNNNTNHVRINSIVPTFASNFTIEAMINTRFKSTINSILSNGNSGANSLGFNFFVNSWQTSNGKLIFEGNGISIETPANTVPIGRWVHVAAVRSGSTISLYVDGVLKATGTFNYIAGTPNFCYLGRFLNQNVTNDPYEFRGGMDNVRIWNKALTASELNTSASMAILSNQPNLIANYEFNQGIPEGSNGGITTLISSTGSNNGSLFNFILNGTSSNFLRKSLSTVNQVLCAGSTVANLVAYPTTPGNQIKWYAAANGGTALNANTALTNNTNYFASEVYGSCESIIRVKDSIVINTAQVNPTSDKVICNGSSQPSILFSTTNIIGTTTYAWTNDKTGIGLAASGIGPLPLFTGINNGTAPEIATIIVTPSFTYGGVTCTGAKDTFLITVNPSAKVTAIRDTTLSKGISFDSIVPVTTNIGGTTTYAWTNNTTSIGLAASGTGNIPTFTTVNSGTAPVTATIIVTPTYTNATVSCSGQTDTFFITINPMAMITNGPQDTTTYSNGAAIPGYSPTTSATGGTVTYNWINNTPSIGLPASGTGPIPTFAGTNTGTSPLTACIIVTPTFTLNGISSVGSPDTFYIIVNPTAMVSPSLPNLTVSPNTPTMTITPTTSATGGTTIFNWTNSVPGIGLPASGTGSIPSFTPINAGTSPITSIIIVTPIFTNGGIMSEGMPDTFTVTVNPIPVINNPIADVITSVGSTIPAYTPTTSATGGVTTYAWTNNNTNTGLGAGGSGTVPSFIGTNTGTAPITSMVIITPTFTLNGVSTVGVPDTVYYTINPVARINAISDTIICNALLFASIMPTTTATGGTTTYTWTNNNTAIGLAASGMGNVPAFTTTNSTTAPIVATIIVTPTFTNANGGDPSVGIPDTFLITINPTARVNPVSSQTLCAGQQVSAVNFGTVNTGGTTTYSWNNNTTSIGLAASGTGNIAAFNAINSTPNAITATITVTPTYTNGGVSCVGEPTTFNITVSPYLSLGNQVWIDDAAGVNTTDYDGRRNGSEQGIDGVTVQLYTTSGSLLQTEVTATVNGVKGMYLFDSLCGGDYIIVIPGSQMQPGGPLANYLSSTGSFNNGGAYESALNDPNNNIDNDDNGTFNSNSNHYFGVVSNTITLSTGQEPLNENPDNDNIRLDANENLTIDFGFIPKVFDLALRKTSMAVVPIDMFNALVEFKIEVINQGNMVAKNIKVNDYLASGFSYMQSDNPLTWMVSGTNAMHMITANVVPNQTVNLSIFLRVQMSNMSSAFVNHAEIANMADTLGNTPTGGPYGSLVDIDSSPDLDPTNDDGSDGSSPDNGADNMVNGNGKSTGNPDDGNPLTDEDDADPAQVRIVDIALVKTIVTPPPYVYGQNVTFEVTVTNQGNVPLSNIVVSDYIPQGYNFIAASNPTWNLAGGIAATTIAGPLAMGQSSSVNIVLTINQIVPASAATTKTWNNVAEVTSMQGQLIPGGAFVNVTGLDIDANLDNNPNNNNGGAPGSADDNNTNGIGDLGQDDDHSDPALLPIYDLALTKQYVNPSAIYVFGNVIPMNITVINQGSAPAYNVVVKEYIPASLTNVGAGPNAGWTFVGSMGTYTIPGPIAPGSNAIVPLNMVFQPAEELTDYVNYAEISDFAASPTGPNASSGIIKDADSTPDNNNSNDDGGVPSFPGSPSGTDNYVDGNGLAPGGAPGVDTPQSSDEDDHDPLLLGFIDMALTKVTTDQQVEPGELVTFNITITNQGTIPSGSITVTDYIPSGFTLADSDWTDNGNGTASYTANITNGNFVSPGLQYNEKYLIPITLLVNTNTLRGTYVNHAEISQILAPNGTTDLTSLDIDSDGDTNPFNDGGGHPDGASDNAVDGNGTGAPGSDDPATDEDDFDPAVVCVSPRPIITGDFFVCPSDMAEFGLTYFNLNNTYTWSVSGSASIVGASSGQSVKLQFDDQPGGVVVLKITETTAYNWCQATYQQVMEIEKNVGLACNDKINLSLDKDCEVEITPELILQGQTYPNESYSVEMNIGGVPIGNVITADHIGKTIVVKVIHDCFGNSCWGVINVEDKLAPVVVCEDSTSTFKCKDIPSAKAGLLALGQPLVSDCSAIIKSYIDEEINGECGNTTIKRTWSIKDKWGNTAPNCVQEVVFEPMKLADVLFPPSLVEINACGQGTSPEDVSAYFDVDSRNGAGIGGYNDDWADSDGIVELNEGFAYGYPHYFAMGKDGKMHAQKIDPSICNIIASYSDQILDVCSPVCSGNTKVIRTWTLLDWCTGAISKWVQVIKSVDQKAPTFIVKDITVSVSPWACAADIDIPAPWELSDNCDSHPSWWIEGPAGISISGNSNIGFKAIGVAKGVHTFTYKAIDCCGNVGTMQANFTVIDRNAPVAVAHQNIVIGLTSSGTSQIGAGKLFATSVNNGSYDFCTDIKIEVRRIDGSPSCDNLGIDGHNNNTTYNNDEAFTLGTSWKHPEDDKDDTDNGAFVKFCCEDLAGAENAIHQVFLRVWDDGNMNGIIGDNLIIDGLQDNYNETWSDVRVENKLPPVIVCPIDATVTCDMELNISTAWKDIAEVNLMTGEADAHDLCAGIKVEFKDTPSWTNACQNVGKIRREFRVVKGSNNVNCYQTITVNTLPSTFVVIPPSNSVLDAPCDFDKSYIKASDKPKIQSGPCDVIGENIDIQEFDFEDGVCKKWLVTYTYINWCTNEQKGPFTKVYKYKDEVKPVLTCSDQMFAANPNPLNINGGCEGIVTLEASANDSGGCIAGGWLKWTILVDAWGNGTYDYEFTSFLPTTDNNLNNDSNGNGIPDRYVAPTSDDQILKVPAFAVDAEMSTHKVLWKVTDGCGNVTTCNSTFMVVDKKAPTPYCVGLSTAVMENGQVELWAIDFNKGSFDNCTAQNALWYSFDGHHPVLSKLATSHYFKGAGQDATILEYNAGNAQRWSPENRSSAMIFNCDDVNASPVQVKMSVWDSKMNTDYCEINLTVIDNQNNCQGTRVAIGGDIKTEKGEGIKNVNVVLNTIVPGYPRNQMSDNFGDYTFDNLPMNLDYEVKGIKRDDWMNGVSTLDLVLIQRHILGISKLDSPYKIIAADVNNDGKVTAADLVVLRKMILGVLTEIPNNNSWRFLDASTPILNPTSPLPVDEIINVNSLSQDMMKENFIGLKVGDVSGNASAVNGKNTELRSKSVLKLKVDDQVVNVGEVIEIPIMADQFNGILGFQFTSHLSGLTLIGVTDGSIRIDSNHYANPQSDLMTMSWNNENGEYAGDGEILFTLRMKAKSSGQLSQMLSMNDLIIEPQAYIGNEMSTSALVFDFGKNDQEYKLYQNEPNPFKTNTEIKLLSPKSTMMKLVITDLAGKQVAIKEVEIVKGINKIALSRNEIKASGFLNYTLSNDEFIASKSMIIVE